MVHSIGRFCVECFAGCSYGNFVDEIFRKFFAETNEGRKNKTPDMKEMCIDCNRCGTFQKKGVECESCKNRFHVKCQTITDKNYRVRQRIHRI